VKFHVKPAGILHLWHLASLDAPTVAVIWALGFAWAAGIRLPEWIISLLALITWTFYIGDRLFDARAANRSCLRERHAFHWRHRRVFAPLAMLSAFAAAAIIFVRMPVSVRQHDSILGMAALAYFSGVHSRRSFPSGLKRILSKEFLVGVIFTAGCALPALSQMSFGRGPSLQSLLVLVCSAFFAALACLNCCAIEFWESGTADSRIRFAGLVLGAVGLALFVFLAPFATRPAALLAAGAASALLLSLLDTWRARFPALTLRTAADLVLLTPIFLFFR